MLGIIVFSILVIASNNTLNNQTNERIQENLGPEDTFSVSETEVNESLEEQINETGFLNNLTLDDVTIEINKTVPLNQTVNETTEQNKSIIVNETDVSDLDEITSFVVGTNQIESIGESVDETILNKTQPTTTFTDKSGNSAGDSLLTTRTDDKFDLDLENGLNTKIEIKGLVSGNITAKIDSINNPLIKTEVFAVDSVEIEEAVITLPKYGEVYTILYCQNFDIELFSCEKWLETDIPFTQTKDAVTFTVAHFTAYAGVEEGIILV